MLHHHFFVDPNLSSGPGVDTTEIISEEDCSGGTSVKCNFIGQSNSADGCLVVVYNRSHLLDGIEWYYFEREGNHTSGSIPSKALKDTGVFMYIHDQDGISGNQEVTHSKCTGTS